MTGAPTDTPPPAATVAINAAAVTVRRWSARSNATVTLLDRVDWTVRAGEHWVLMGPNGAGKTTLLRIAGAHAHPTEGEVEILGRRLGRFDVRRLRERIGFVDERLAQALAARGRMTAREIVLTGALGTVALPDERPDAALAAQVNELLELVDLAAIAERRFAHCSQGERARLMIARSLVAEPDLLLLDEPAAGLDMPSRERFIATMAATAAGRPQLPSVTVTHHLEEIPPSCTHALLLRAGQVVAGGPVSEVLTSEHVSACFGVEVEVTAGRGRYQATIRI